MTDNTIQLGYWSGGLFEGSLEETTFLPLGFYLYDVAPATNSNPGSFSAIGSGKEGTFSVTGTIFFASNRLNLKISKTANPEKPNTYACVISDSGHQLKSISSPLVFLRWLCDPDILPSYMWPRCGEYDLEFVNQPTVSDYYWVSTRGTSKSAVKWKGEDGKWKTVAFKQYANFDSLEYVCNWDDTGDDGSDFTWRILSTG
ncbi:hypothetical protein BJV74DRAFT_627320 [Russula compacta]|nr:hypothetical protein BJV74DRAFT_627320 [Russula compacta]